MSQACKILFMPILFLSIVFPVASEGNRAEHYFGNDSRWYEENIPFIDIPDSEITDVYYYRWSMYKRHFRDLGTIGTIITEFAPSVSWEGPYSGISAAAGHHVYEGRWIKDRKYIDDYLSFWFNGHGNQFQYSSWLCDALYNYYLVKGDIDGMKNYLPVMIADYEGWKAKRFDPDKGIYWQKPVEDATEYTVAGYMVDDGWAGDAYRPTINTFMYANANAVRKVAEICGDDLTAEKYRSEADKLKKSVQEQLWNSCHMHFMDRLTERYKDKHLNFEFINAPELNGYVPWMFSLPDDNDVYVRAWEKFMNPKVFYSPFGPGTISKQSPYYMKETRTPGAKPGLGECEWNGPSWPYQTSQVLMAMKNLINEYDQSVIGKKEYFDILKNYTRSQFKDGRPYIAENLHPETGAWIADFPNRSEHYNHSTYNDLILNGLLGIQPQPDDKLLIRPLIPDAWDYFSVTNLTYHGHQISIYYDKTGKRYNKGKGISVYANDKPVAQFAELGKHTVNIPPGKKQEPVEHILNYAFNNKGEGFPKASASFTCSEDRIHDAIDGRTWCDEFPRNRWTTLGSDNKEEWFEVDFGDSRLIDAAEITFYDNGTTVLCPQQVQLEYWDGTGYKLLKVAKNIVSGTSNRVTFNQTNASKVRLVFTKKQAAVGLAEFKIGRLDRF